MIDILKEKTSLDRNSITDGGLTTFLNPVSYLKARKHLHTYRQFNYLLADGWLFVAALKAIGIKTQRYSFDMTSLAPVVLMKAAEQNQTIYFIGARPDEIRGFIKIIKTHFPGLSIAGYRDGYFKSADERTAAIAHIKDLSPNIVVAGLGVPFQEDFLVDLRNAGWSGCGYTCGGFIHQTSGRLNYYPDWVNKFHLRMPYRFIREPHFRKRLPDYIKFVFTFLYDYWKHRQSLYINR